MIDDDEYEEERQVTHAMRFHGSGGAEALRWEEVQVGRPGASEAGVRNTAAGRNDVDTYFQSGLYPVALPNGLGSEGRRCRGRRSLRERRGGAEA